MGGLPSLEDLRDRLRASEAGDHLAEAFEAQRRALTEVGLGVRSLVDLDSLAAMPREFLSELVTQAEEAFREQTRGSTSPPDDRETSPSDGPGPDGPGPDVPAPDVPAPDVPAPDVPAPDVMAPDVMAPGATEVGTDEPPAPAKKAATKKSPAKKGTPAKKSAPAKKGTPAKKAATKKSPARKATEQPGDHP